MREVAVGILEQGGKILACQRKRNAVYGLKWEFPGGKIEAGETPAEALRRELREELDVDAVIGPEFYRQEWLYPDGVADPEKEGSFRVYFYLVSAFHGTPVNRAFERILWADGNTMRELDFLEGTREAIARYLAHAAGEELPR
jgi:8-oxo-dGTP diphosphatase